MECDYQGTSAILLRKHETLKHSTEGYKRDKTIRCKICAKEFTEKWNFMKHRKNNHPEAVGYCRKYESETCSFTAESCWWNHEQRKQNTGIAQCFICSQTFDKKSKMMSQRKKTHLSIVQTCSKFKEGNCRFQKEFL